MQNVEAFKREALKRVRSPLRFNASTFQPIAISSLVIRLLTLAIRSYQLTISPALTLLFGPAGGCRFTPSCSQYALDAVHARGALAGGALAVRRICRCHPWGDCGHDPVPKKKFGSRNSEFGI